MYPKLSLDFLLPKIDLQANIYGVRIYNVQLVFFR